MRQPEGEEVPVRVECQNLFQRESRSGPDKVSGAAVRDVIKLMEGILPVGGKGGQEQEGKSNGWLVPLDLEDIPKDGRTWGGEEPISKVTL